MDKNDNAIESIVQLFLQRGHSEYGGESVTQLEHALQAAWIAEQENASADLITAALLHDFGHILHDLPDDAPEQGIDDKHETMASAFLRTVFPESVVSPVEMHVDAKRYLCAVDKNYFASLSQPSITSLELQGGPMNAAEVQAFESEPYFQDAARLRRWDDLAKVVGLETPPLEHFVPQMLEAARGGCL